MLTTVQEDQSTQAPQSRVETIRTDHVDRGAPLFVWAVWALMLLVALAFVMTYGVNVPFGDDWWNWVPLVTDGQPLTIARLWKPHSATAPHRLPLPNLLNVCSYWITNSSQGAKVFDVLLQGALAFTLILTARGLRGRVSYKDAFFPLLLLNLGQAPNMLWALLLNGFVFTFLAGVVFFIIARNQEPRLGTALLVGALLVMFPLCSGAGIPFVPPIALWLCYVAFLHWRDGGPHALRNCLLILGLVACAILLLILYLKGLRGVELMAAVLQKPSTMVIAKVRVFLQLMGQAIFGVTMRNWPRWARAAGQLVAAAFYLSTVALLVPPIFRRPDERTRALGLLAFFGAMLGVVAIITLGRSNGLENQYVILTVAGVCGLYITWMLYGPPRIGKFITAALFVSQLVLVLPEFRHGVSLGKYHKYRIAAFERDARAGMPTYMLLGRYARLLCFERTAVENARRAGFGVFSLLKGDPEFREVPVPVEPVVVHDIAWEGGVVRSVGKDPYLMFKLPEPRFVSGIRLEYSHESEEGGLPEPFLIPVKQGDWDRFSGPRARVSGSGCRGPGPETVLTWIGATVQEFCIRPATYRGTYTLRILGITLLVPAQEDLFTVQGGDLEVPESPTDFDSKYWLTVRGQYEGVWPVDLLHSLPVFVNDVLYGVRVPEAKRLDVVSF